MTSILMGIARHALGAISGGLILKGNQKAADAAEAAENALASGDQTQFLTGCILLVFVVAWSAWNKRTGKL